VPYSDNWAGNESYWYTLLVMDSDERSIDSRINLSRLDASRVLRLVHDDLYTDFFCPPFKEVGRALS